MKLNTILLVTLISAGCTSTIDPGDVSSYPRTKNNTWNYVAQASITNFRPVHSGTTFPDTSIEWIAQVRAEGPDTLLDSVAAWKFSTRDTGALTSNGVQYYIVKGDTFSLFAYYNPSLAAPKRSHGFRFSVGTRQYQSLQDIVREFSPEMNIADTLYVETNPPPVLVFPLGVGREWEYRHTPFRINKRITGAEEVNTPAGTFACYTLRWLWDIDGNGTWDSVFVGTDHLNSSGLIQRSILVRGVGISIGDNPEIIGYADLENKFTISSLEGSIYPAALRRH